MDAFTMRNAIIDGRDLAVAERDDESARVLRDAYDAIESRDEYPSREVIELLENMGIL